MHKARAFFYVCAGLFLLALSYHLGARNAGAQAPGNPVVGSFPNGWSVVTANGDVYLGASPSGPWALTSNIFGGPTPAQRESFGSLKARNRGGR